ncbi:MAG: integrase core domain-containing protein [Cellulomonadaceae bacterium]|jgi:transposase InsO family protein|nr:integrase core domain-containing protein [Cellulomonadaceae bacterium]
MSTRRLVITAVLQGNSQAEVARTYGVSQGWISKVMARYRIEGEAAFEPKSRARKTHAEATGIETVEKVLALRADLTTRGLDAGADTIKWHLRHHHHIELSRATIHRILTRAQVVTPEPKKRPKSSTIRFEAAQPNETWQSDFTHYRLTRPDGRPGADTEIITWIDDCSRLVLHCSAHNRITAKIVKDTFCQAGDLHGYPASTLTDNGMVYTVRLATGRGGRTALEKELQARHITQKNGRPNKPTTQGKVERFQATLKKWLRAQPNQPTTINELNTLITVFITEYNQHRPHRALPHQSTPTTIYTTRPKATPNSHNRTDTHNRVRHDKIDSTGKLTLRHAGKLHHIGIGRTHARTPIIMLIQDLNITVIHAATGEILRELTLDTTRDYQPLHRPPNPTTKNKEA